MCKNKERGEEPNAREVAVKEPRVKLSSVQNDSGPLSKCA
jgi:hypothetical protein